MSKYTYQYNVLAHSKILRLHHEYELAEKLHIFELCNESEIFELTSISVHYNLLP